MLCTINTDASFHPIHKVGAYAFWAVSNEFKIQKAGYLRDLCKDPTEAEINCIINAFHVIVNSNSNITKIIFNTDSKNAISVFENQRKQIHKYNLFRWKDKRKKFKGLIKHYRNITKSNRNIEVEFRHVKAHSGVKDARSYVNEWCDKNAKTYLWKRINQLKLQQND